MFDTDENKSTRKGESKRTERPSLNRRRFLQAAGVGLGGLSLSSFSGDIATAKTSCADGPFRRTYAGGTVNLGEIRAKQATEMDPGAAVATSHPQSDEDVADLRRSASNAEGAQPSRAVAQEATADAGLLSVETEYDGVNAEETRGGVPSDSQVAVGDGKIVHALNQQVAIYNKQSGQREHMIRLERLWEPVIDEPDGGFVFDVPFVFDPRARYDRAADRFVVCATQFQFGLTADGETIDREDLEEGEVEAEDVSRSPQGWWLVAVSATNNPNGEWHVYRVPPIRNDGLVDYPTLGFDQDAVYLTQNFFGSVFEVTMVTLDKAAMYAGEDVTAHHFTGMNDPDSDGITFTVQPASQPYSGGTSGAFYLVNSDFPFPDASPETLTLWELTDPLSDPTLECFTLDVDPYSYPPPARQPDSDGLIDTLGTRVMNADYDDGSLWTAHSLQYDWDGDGRAVSAIRWYEIDPASRSVVQSGVYGEPGTSYFLPTIGADAGRTVIAHNVSGPDTYVRMDAAGRTADHAQGELEDSVVVQPGESRYDFGEGFGTPFNPLRWGDYNGVSVDPSSGRFWTVAQYSPNIDIDPEAEERDPYHTRIAEIAFDE